jgi:transcriptional regulator GlxA family with amidase domain
MKHISIVLPAGEAVLGSIEGPYKIFSEANEILKRLGKPPLFKLELVGLNRQVSYNNKLYTLNAQRTLKDSFKTDLIIIPAPHGDMKEQVELNRELISWIEKKYKKGAEVASLCMGAFLLAATGLLRGKKCATHWIAANEFKEMYPDVILVPEKIITDEKGIYSSGGAYSYLNLVLYLVEKYAGRKLAVLCAKIFAVEIDRQCQSYFTIFNGQKEHDDDAIRKAQEFIETNFGDKLTVEQLSSMCLLGRRNFERRFKKATSNTVMEYIQRVKIEAAKMSLESSKENVNQIMYSVGYSDTKAFRTTFKKITGISPIEYRNKYNKEAVVIPKSYFQQHSIAG